MSTTATITAISIPNPTTPTRGSVADVGTSVGSMKSLLLVQPIFGRTVGFRLGDYDRDHDHRKNGDPKPRPETHPKELLFHENLPLLGFDVAGHRKDYSCKTRKEGEYPKKIENPG